MTTSLSNIAGEEQPVTLSIDEVSRLTVGRWEPAVSTARHAMRPADGGRGNENLSSPRAAYISRLNRATIKG